MKKNITVAAIQMEIKMLDVNTNLDKAQRMLKSLFSKQQCDLVVFPEDFISGPIPYNLELSVNENSPSISLFKRLAVIYRTYIVCGSVIKRIGKDFYNTSFLINNKGQAILEYQKINLWHPEKRYLTPGNAIRVVKTPLGNIGIVICWDLAFSDIFHKLVEENADIVCCPSYWTATDGIARLKKYRRATENIMVNTLCPARAIENEILFVYTNAGGQAEVRLSTKIWRSPQIGQSQICVPIYGTVAKIDDNREGFITYKFNRDLLKDAERIYKIKEDMKINFNKN